RRCNESRAPGGRHRPAGPDPRLPAVDLAALSALLPLHAELFRVRPPGGAPSRAACRRLARGQAPRALPPLGRVRLRPRAGHRRRVLPVRWPPSPGSPDRPLSRPWSPTYLMEQRNLLVAIVVSLAILIGFQFLFPPAPPPVQPEQQQAAEGAPAPSGSVPTLSGEPGAPGAELPGTPSREQAIGISPRIAIETPTVSGSIALRGARIDDL